MSSEDYTSKYLKYKNKYLKLKQAFVNNQSGGNEDDIAVDELERLTDTPTQTEVYGRKLKSNDTNQYQEPQLSGGAKNKDTETQDSESSDSLGSSSSDSSSLSDSSESPLQSSPITSEMNASLTLSSLKSEL
jgi:hypothetical protein